MKATLSSRLKELSERASSLQRLCEVEGFRRAELSLVATALATSVKERTGWLNVLRSSTEHVSSTAVDVGTRKDADISILVSNLGLEPGTSALDSASWGEESACNDSWTGGIPPVEYIRSQIKAQHLDAARGASWVDINSRCQQAAEQAAHLLEVSHGPDAKRAAAAEEELISTITDSYAFLIAAHIVQPSEMWKADATRMDTNEPAGVPESVARLAIARIELSTQQRRAIAAGYGVYLKSLPHNERKRLLEQLSETPKRDPFGLGFGVASWPSLAAAAEELESMLQKWQQSGLTLATLVGNVMTLKQVCCAVVAFYPYWYSASDCEY